MSRKARATVQSQGREIWENKNWESGFAMYGKTVLGALCIAALFQAQQLLKLKNMAPFQIWLLCFIPVTLCVFAWIRFEEFDNFLKRGK